MYVVYRINDPIVNVERLRRWTDVPSDISAGLAHVEDATQVTFGDVAQLASSFAAMHVLRCLDCFDDEVRLRVARVMALAARRAGCRRAGRGARAKHGAILAADRRQLSRSRQQGAHHRGGA
jgi:hypothetical protein